MTDLTNERTHARRRHGHRRVARTVVAAAVALAAITGPVHTAHAAGSTTVTFLKTLAGPSQAQMYPSGIAYDTLHNRIVLADTGYDTVDFYDPTTGQETGTFGGYGTANGQFDTDRQVAVDNNPSTDPESGWIFVADAANNRIQAFDSTGKWKWTGGCTGPQPQCLNTPIGIGYVATNDTTPGDLANVLLVADTGHNLVKAYDPANGNYLWSSPKVSSGDDAFIQPRDSTVGPDGRLWVDDYGHEYVKAFTVQNIGGTATGNGGTTGIVSWTSSADIKLGDGLKAGHNQNEVNSPYNIAFSPDGHTAYIADTGNYRVSRWNLTTSPPTALTPFGGPCPKAANWYTNPCPLPPANAAYLVEPRRVVVDPSGNVWVADFWGSGIHEWHPDGSTGTEIAAAPAAVPGFAQAFGVTVGGDGTTYVVDRLNQRVERFAADGTYENVVGRRGTSAGQFSWPETAAVAPDGTLWVGDTRKDRLQHFAADLTATLPTIVGSTGSALGQYNNIDGDTVDATGVVWSADTNNSRIESYDPVAKAFTAYGAYGGGTAQFNHPDGVAVTGSSIYVADSLNNRIVELGHSGTGGFGWVTTATTAGGTALNDPQGVAVAPDGTVWVADTGNSRIVHYSATLQDLGDAFGSLDSSSTPGNYGFFQPHSLAVSPAGSPNPNVLFVADTFNNRVQEYTLTPNVGPPSKLAFTTEPAGATTGAPFSTQPTVTVEDSNGRTVTTDGSQVTLAITSGTGTSGAALSCTGGLTATAQNGVAHFSGCSIDTAGSGYTLTATDGTLTSAVSTAFSVAPPFTLNPSYSSQIYNAAGVAGLYPEGGAVDAAGNMYITDSSNSRIVEQPAGTSILQPIVTTGLGHPRGMALDPDGLHLWVPNTDNAQIDEYDLAGNQQATVVGSRSNLLSPYGVAVDTKNVYVANTYGHNVIAFAKSAPNTPLWKVTTCGGTALSRTRGIGWGPDGNLYVADEDNNRIVVISPTTSGSCLTSFGHAGSKNGQFNAINDVIGDPGGNGIWVSDEGNHRIQHLSTTGAFISATSGGYGSGPNQFTAARSMFVDNGMVAVSDTYSFDVELFTVDSSGNPVYAGRTAQGTPPALGGFNGPFADAYDSAGNLYVADWLNHRIERFAAGGGAVTSFAQYGEQPGGIEYPRGVAVSADGSTIAVTNESNNVSFFAPDGTYKSRVAPADGSGLHRPRQVVFDPADGSLWIADALANRVVHMALNGTVLTVITTGPGGAKLNQPQGVAVDSAGNVYVSDTNNNAVDVFTHSGGFVSTLASNGTGATSVNTPMELTLAGPPGSQVLLIADSGNNRVLALHTDGTADLVIGTSGTGNGQLTTPYAVAYSSVTDSIAIADFGNDRISLWSAG